MTKQKNPGKLCRFNFLDMVSKMTDDGQYATAPTQFVEDCQKEHHPLKSINIQQLHTY
jgi:hypothetical protein